MHCYMPSRNLHCGVTIYDCEYVSRRLHTNTKLHRHVRDCGTNVDLGQTLRWAVLAISMGRPCVSTKLFSWRVLDGYKLCRRHVPDSSSYVEFEPCVRSDMPRRILRSTTLSGWDIGGHLHPHN